MSDERETYRAVIRAMDAAQREQVASLWSVPGVKPYVEAACEALVIAVSDVLADAFGLTGWSRKVMIDTDEIDADVSRTTDTASD